MLIQRRKLRTGRGRRDGIRAGTWGIARQLGLSKAGWLAENGGSGQSSKAGRASFGSAPIACWGQGKDRIAGGAWCVLEARNVPHPLGCFTPLLELTGAHSDVSHRLYLFAKGGISTACMTGSGTILVPKSTKSLNPVIRSCLTSQKRFVESCSLLSRKLARRFLIAFAQQILTSSSPCCASMS